MTLQQESKDFIFSRINGRVVCLKGVGKLFYQDGFPISLSVQALKEKGVTVSIFHVADECLKHGWSPKTTFTKMKEEEVDVEGLYEFCFADYETQREMIFRNLFKNKDVIECLK